MLMHSTTKDRIFLNSIPKRFRTPKTLELLESIQVDNGYLLDDLIRYKTHFTYLANIKSTEFQEAYKNKYFYALDMWCRFQEVRLDFARSDLGNKVDNRFCSLKALNVLEFISSRDYYRFHNDIDVVVDSRLIYTLRDELIQKDGFIVGNFSFPSYEFFENQIDKSLEERHYELSQMSKLYPLDSFLTEFDRRDFQLFINFRLPVCFYKGELYFHLSIDLHKNISNDFSTDFFWKNFVEKSDVSKGYRMPLEDFIWYTSLKMYYEIHSSSDISIKDRLRHLVDLYIVITEYEDAINWDSLIKKAEILEMQPALYYTFSFLENYLDCFYLKSLVSRFNDQRRSYKFRSKDFGCFSEKLFNW